MWSEGLPVGRAAVGAGSTNWLRTALDDSTVSLFDQVFLDVGAILDGVPNYLRVDMSFEEFSHYMFPPIAVPAVATAMSCVCPLAVCYWLQSRIGYVRLACR